MHRHNAPFLFLESVILTMLSDSEPYFFTIPFKARKYGIKEYVQEFMIHPDKCQRILS